MRIAVHQLTNRVLPNISLKSGVPANQVVQKLVCHFGKQERKLGKLSGAFGTYPHPQRAIGFTRGRKKSGNYTLIGLTQQKNGPRRLWIHYSCSRPAPKREKER